MRKPGIKGIKPGGALICCLFCAVLFAQVQPLSRNDSAQVLLAEENFRNELARNNLKQASHYLNTIARIYWDHNQTRKAIEYYERSLELNQGLGNESGAAMIRGNLGLLYADLRDYRRSFEEWQKVLATRRSFGDKENIIEALINSAVSLNSLRRYEESVRFLEEAADISRQINNRERMLDNLLRCYSYLSETYEKAGNPALSRQYYDQYRTFSEEKKRIDIRRMTNALDEQTYLKELAEAEEKKKAQELINKQKELLYLALAKELLDSTNQVLDTNLAMAELNLSLLRKQRQSDSTIISRDKEIIRQQKTVQRSLGLASISLLAVCFVIYLNFIQVKRSKKILAEKNGLIEKQNRELEDLNRIIAAHNLRMKKELDVGQEIQMSMLPKIYPPGNLLDMHALLDPAREVGGDLYDFFMTDDEHLLFGIGDVSGKGVPAALFMAVTKTLVKAHGIKMDSPAAILSAVNEDLQAENEKSMFVSYFLGKLNLRTGSLVYSNAGHLPPIVRNKQGSKKLEGIHGPVLGAVDAFHYQEGRITLEPDERLLLYTDGVTEAMNIRQEQYGEDRLMKFIDHKSSGGDSRTLVDALRQDLSRFAGNEEQSDDITMIAMARK
ncbi:MAG TPA: SpoIIE family protein phosphatase [Saprospiraceae bacterium]|nr:SpoIIE family protein phosphatase [Saprospiraceae bacterium]HNT22099.1 SpoIIE family protein phosphatase [Saprospiraceae bacterium]